MPQGGARGQNLGHLIYFCFAFIFLLYVIIMSTPCKGREIIVFPLTSVCGSVCPSQNCVRLITITVTSMKLNTFVKHFETTCHAQEP